MSDRQNADVLPEESRDDTLMESSMENDDLDDFIPSSQPNRVLGLDSTSRDILEESAEIDPSLSTIEDTIPIGAADTEAMVSPADASSDFIPSSELRIKRKLNLPEDEAHLCKRRLEVNSEECAKGNSEDIWGPSQPFTPNVADVMKVAESPTILGSQDSSLVEESPNKSDKADDCLALDLEVETYIARQIEDSFIDIADASALTATVPVAEFEADPIAVDIANTLPAEEINSNASTVPFPVSQMNGLTPEEPETVSKVEKVVLDSSFIIVSQTGARPVAPLEVVELDSTVDANDFSCPEMFADSASRETSENTAKVPSDKRITQFKLDNLEVPKHSTPENNATKPLNIDGSASSIENITPEHLKKDQEFEICFTVDLTVSCKIVVDANKEIKNKTIISVAEWPKPRASRDFQLDNDSSDKSKSVSASSSGTVYSDKTGLPYPLPPRPSMTNVNSSSEEMPSAERTKPWKNELMLRTKINEVIPRFVSQYFRDKSSLHRKAMNKARRMAEKDFSDDISSPELSASSRSANSLLPKGKRWSDKGNSKEEEVHKEAPQKEPEKKQQEEKREPEEEEQSAEEEQSEEEEEEVQQQSEEEEEGEEIEGDDLQDGLPVFARWTDKKYYPGKLKGSSKHDKWEVAFDDGTSKNVREDMILPAKLLVVGQLVFALVIDKYESGRIADVKKEKKTKYLVELDFSDERVNVYRSDLCLSDDMASILREHYKPTVPSTPLKLSSAIDFDNVVVGKRVREQRTPIQTTPIQPPSSSSRRKRNSKSASDENLARINEPGPSGSSKSSVSGRDRSSRKSKCVSFDIQKEDKELGETPTNETPKSSAKKKRKGRGNVAEEVAAETSGVETPVRSDKNKGKGTGKATEELPAEPTREETPIRSDRKRGRGRGKSVDEVEANVSDGETSIKSDKKRGRGRPKSVEQVEVAASRATKRQLRGRKL